MTLSPPQPVDPEDRKWQNLLEKKEMEQLEDIRGAAEKWSTTISALTGIFSIVVLIKGPDDITKLVPLATGSVGLLLVIALGFAFAAIYLAALAAQGVPKSSYTGDANYRKTYQQMVDDAVKHLKESRQFVVIATIALAVAIGVTWYGPKPPDQPVETNVLVVKQSGAVACGALSVGSTGELAFKSAAKDSQSVILADITELRVVEACPK